LVYKKKPSNSRKNTRAYGAHMGLYAGYILTVFLQLVLGDF